MRKNNPAYPYLQTLRLLDDDIILVMASAPLFMDSPCACLCGTALRTVICDVADFVESGEYGNFFGLDELFDRLQNKLGYLYAGALVTGVPNQMVKAFGGSLDEWQRLYWGATSQSEAHDTIELAFVERVLEAVRQG